MSVSVIIPVYNGEGLIETAVRSALACEADEVIVVDDGSFDNTLNICKRMAMENVHVRVVSQSHKGVGAARNTGIREAKSEFVFFCDCDDVMLSIPQEKMDRRFDLIFSGSEIVNLHGDDTSETITNVFKPQAHKDPFHFYVKYDIKNRLNSLWILFARRDFLLEKELFFNESIRINEDVEFVIRALAAAEYIRAIPDVCYSYQRRVGRSAAFVYTNVTGKVINLIHEAVSSFGKKGRRYATGKTLDRLYAIETSSRTLAYKKQLRHDMRESQLLRKISPISLNLKVKRWFLMFKGY